MPENIKTPSGSGQTITSSGTNSDESILIPGASMKGIRVCSKLDDDLGVIVDTIIDPLTARVLYYSVALESGDGATHAVPVARLKYDPERREYISDQSLEQLQSASNQAEILHEDHS